MILQTWWCGAERMISGTLPRIDAHIGEPDGLL